MIHGIQRDRQGTLWLGTFGKGLIVFSPQKGTNHAISTLPMA